MPVAKKKAPTIEVFKDGKGREYTIEMIELQALDPYNSLSQIDNRYDGAAVEEYARLMRDGKWDWERVESFPVVFREIDTTTDENGEIVREESLLHIGDGHHTVEAADSESVQETLKLETIKCKVYAGTLLDAKSYSYREANRYHGVRVTNLQKREAVKGVLTDRAMLNMVCETVSGSNADDIPSDRLIAAYLNDLVSLPTIADIWDKLVEEDEKNEYPWLRATSRLREDGKRQKVKIKPKKVDIQAEIEAAKPAKENPQKTSEEPIEINSETDENELVEAVDSGDDLDNLGEDSIASDGDLDASAEVDDSDFSEDFENDLSAQDIQAFRDLANKHAAEFCLELQNPDYDLTVLSELIEKSMFNAIVKYHRELF
jgi:hypothetical protein